jgi:hypothetical protein
MIRDLERQAIRLQQQAEDERSVLQRDLAEEREKSKARC